MPESRDRERDLFNAAAPLCGVCGKPVQRAEMPWVPDGERGWVIVEAALVCASEHRTIVRAFDGD